MKSKLSSLAAAMRGFFAGVVPVQDDPMSFTVQRSKWLRGEKANSKGSGLNEDGEFCCLGFLCTKVGYTPEQIEGLCYPSTLVDRLVYNNNKDSKFRYEDLHPMLKAVVDEHEREYANGMVYANPQIVIKIANINDDANLTDAEREQQVTELFLRLGITIKFVD